MISQQRLTEILDEIESVKKRNEALEYEVRRWRDCVVFDWDGEKKTFVSINGQKAKEIFEETGEGGTSPLPV